MEIEEAIAKKKDIEGEITRKLNLFIQETGLTIEGVEIRDKMQIHGQKDRIRITLDVRL